MALSGCKQES